MKIAHVTSGLVRSAAGVREVVMALSTAQATLGHDVRVFGLDDPAWESERHDWTGAPVSAFRVFGPRAFGYAPGILSALLEFAPDVVHLHGLWMHPGRSVLQWHRRTGRPYLFSPHGMLSPLALRYSRSKKRLAETIFQNSVFGSASAVHVTAKHEADDVRNYGLSKVPIILVPNGVPEVCADALRKLENARKVLSLGRLHSVKGLDLLLAAWSQVSQTSPDWDLEIVGADEGGELERLTALAARLGLKRVTFGEAVFGQDKIDLMASAGIFVLPSRSENFAITVAESLMVSVPVVVSKGAPWSDVEEIRCGHWVDATPEGIAFGLRALMALSDDQRREMGAKGREWMLRDFAWPGIAARMIAAYEDVCK